MIPANNFLFASEMVGAVRGIDPETGYFFVDTKRYIAANTDISAADKEAIFSGTAKKVFSRLKLPG